MNWVSILLLSFSSPLNWLNTLSFTLWQYAKQVNILLYPIRKSVFKELEDDKLRFFDKFKQDFHKTVHKRYWNNELKHYGGKYVKVQNLLKCTVTWKPLTITFLIAESLNMNCKWRMLCSWNLYFKPWAVPKWTVISVQYSRRCPSTNCHTM